MGNKSNKSTPSAKNYPPQMLGGGIPKAGGSGGDQNGPIRIKLIRVDPNLVPQVREKQRIYLSYDHAEGYSCYYDGKVLGKVARNWDPQLEAPMTHTGFIYKIVEAQLSVTIELD